MAYLSWLIGLLRPRLQLGFASVAAASLLVAGFMPLLAGPGYEASLAAGLLLPSLVACSTALETAGWPSLPSVALTRGLTRGCLYALLGLVITLAHGLRVGLCDPLRDIALWLLGAGCGTVLGGGWGACAGLVAGRIRRGRTALAAALALAGPLGGIAVSLWRFYSGPMVFAYDPFFGLFAGPVYDTVVEHTDRLVSYRLGSALTLVAAGVGAAHLDRGRDGRLCWRRIRRPGVLVLGLLAAGASISLQLGGAQLGHWSSEASVRQALGREVAARRCDVIFSSNILDRDARALALECDAHFDQLERFWGAPRPERVQVYLFASAAEKGRLIGAASTHVAKPWRGEVYLQQRGFPHPVLRHELAHVIAATFGTGPFRVAGPLGGWVPDPGRIEGVAVAAAPGHNADLTLQQWARTLLDLELLPPLGQLFRLSFLGENPSKAYTVAGAFIQWLRQQYGAEAVRRWYGGAELGQVLGGRSLEKLEAEWHASLTRVEVPEQAPHAARARFDRPAIFGRRCPHAVDRLEQEARRLLAQNNHHRAQRAYQQLLELDPAHTAARIGLGKCALRAGDEAQARQRFAAVAQDSNLGRLDRAAAEELLADLDLVAGRVKAAARTYAELMPLYVQAGRLRALELKQGVADPTAREAVVALLIPDPQLGPTWDVAASRLSSWAERQPEQGIASYLLAKNFFVRGRWAEAAGQLQQATQRDLPSARIRAEAWRLMVVLACVRGNRERARHAYRGYLDEPNESRARREAMQRFAERCGVGRR